MAREVLAILISTVASESSFNVGGRILNPYQTSLTPRMVQVLVCMQDWLKGIYFSMFIDEDFKELEKFEQGKLISMIYIFLLCFYNKF